MRLKIKNTTDLKVIMDTEVTDKGTSARFYTFDITLPEGIPDGEYEYTLQDDGLVLSTGIIKIQGHGDKPNEQYNKEIEYKQYGTGN